ncbi:hypothetical protein ONS95_000726 [Cadophora gregata]|uniref:uncharacterized protein n=1 Tax=Cadophora gregata TaxID=51156 RepID=UPI0026DB9AFD|nr:uncharacterized protein ONS95_000726 [Cadophora gregata]KAK0103098.1 hypothetical protein ONS96_005707 [Cadophora gregata f. sp. sojae]KAK0128775.1 hypothetical protein ONS95_000726 [Cadophora gregata]
MKFTSFGAMAFMTTVTVMAGILPSRQNGAVHCIDGVQGPDPAIQYENAECAGDCVFRENSPDASSLGNLCAGSCEFYAPPATGPGNVPTSYYRCTNTWN